MKRRAVCMVVLSCVVPLSCLVPLAGCAPDPAGPASTPIVTPSSASPSVSPLPWPDLTRPGVARSVIADLRMAAGDFPVIKIEITAAEASLSVVVDNKARTYAYREATISEVDSSTEYNGQASFDPDVFDLSDVATLFTRAATIAGSSSNQELQIVEYNNSQVLMTVTTRPESMPVFLRPDGSAINQLDATTKAGLDEGLTDVLIGATQVLAIGYSDQQGLWVDVPGAEPGTIERRTRPDKFPVFTAGRKESTDLELFSPSELDTALLAKLIRTLPTTLDAGPGAPVDFTIDRRNRLARPTIDWQIGSRHVTTDMAGADIGAVVGR